MSWFVLLAGLAGAGPDQTLTGETLEAGDVVVRFPTGPSAVGLTDRTELWVTPVDIGIGGPRLGVEHALWDRDGLAWSLRPSIGIKHTTRRQSVRLGTTISQAMGPHRVSLDVAADLRLLLRVTLDTERSAAWSVDGVQAPLSVVYDWRSGRSTVRARVTLPLRDRGRTLAYGSGYVAYQHDFGRVHIETGIGLLVGHPADQWALDTYRWFFALPYPKLDVWLTL